MTTVEIKMDSFLAWFEKKLYEKLHIDLAKINSSLYYIVDLITTLKNQSDQLR